MSMPAGVHSPIYGRIVISKSWKKNKPDIYQNHNINIPQISSLLCV